MSISENLYNLGALMKTNLERKGVTGLTGNEGLTTLANKILDIEGNGSECNCNRIVLTSEGVNDGVSQENIVSYNFTATLNILNESNANKSIVLELYESDSEEPFSELRASTSNSGEATFSYRCQNKGELEVVAKYNDISSNIVTITDNVIIKLNTRFNYSSSNITIKEGQTANITGTLLDENDNYLSDKQIVLENINSSNHSAFRTNNIGQYNIPLTLTDAGNYEYRVIFNGDTYYNSSSTNAITVTVREVYSSSLNIYTNNSIVISGETINIGGKLTCDDINNANVKVYRNNVLLNTITVNSDGTFNTSDTIMDGGDYVYKVVYEGDEYHTNSESNTVNVHVADYELTVAPTKRIVSNGEVNKIQATLTDDGNPVENVEISLNIEGNIVGITTGSNGVAEYNYTGTGNKGKIHILATIKNRNVVMGQTSFYDGVDNYITANISGNTITIGDAINNAWLQSSGTVEIDWGDGTSNYVRNPTTSLTHNYTDNLTTHTVIFSEEVTGIGEYCFYNCTGLTSITIPNTVTSLGLGCFAGCTSLTSVTIPSSVTSLGNNCFQSCTGLTSVTIPNSVTSLPYSCFTGCSGLTSVTIPSSVTSLGEYCFSQCAGLTSITIPNTVTSIGNYCFNSCTSLIDYELYWMSNPVAYDSQKMPVNTNTVFNIPYSTTSIYSNAGYLSDRLVERSGTPTDLTLTGDSVIQKTETATITALLEYNGLPVNNKSLSYSVKHGTTVLDSGTVTTNSSGQATISYVGTGIGDVDVEVKYSESFSTLLQETYEVKDGLFRDTSTTPNNKWWSTATTGSITHDAMGITFNNTGTGYSRMHPYTVETFPSTWSEKENAVKFMNTPFIVEFDVKSISNTNTITLDTNSTVYNNNVSPNDHVKLVCDGSTGKVYINDVEVNSKSYTFTNSWFALRITSTVELKIDNFIIYPI